MSNRPVNRLPPSAAHGSPARPLAPSPIPSIPLLPWAVMAMEVAILYPLLVGMLGGPQQGTTARALAALALLPLGYLAARRYPRLRGGGRRWAVGAVASLGLRLLMTPLPEQLPGLESLVAWLGSALAPAGLGLLLWWRGTALIESEFTAAGLRNEFALIGAGLLALLGLYGHLFVTDTPTRVLAVLLYVCGGLVALGLVRQEEANLPTSSGAAALVALAVLALLGLTGVLLVLLHPELVVAVLAVLEQVLLLLIRLLLLPLVLLFSWLQLELPGQEEQGGGRSGAVGEPPVPQQLPEWLVSLFGAAFVVFAVLAVLLFGAILLWLLSTVLQRWTFRGALRPAVATENIGSPWEDARALMAALRGRLAGLASGLPLARHRIDDARAAYRALLRWARSRGLERAASETPREFEQRLAAHLPEGAPSYRLLTEHYELARYGGEAAAGPVLSRLRGSLEELGRLASQGNRESR